MSCRVVYVDDQEDIVWSTTRLLARNCPELEVESFTDPKQALDAVTQNPPDILVTDLRMEGMSGLELMVAARKVVPELPVIVVTAYGGPGLSSALRGRSLVEYLEKPIRTERLVECIDRLLDRGEGFSGAISLPMLPDLVQVYTLSKTTGALSIRRGASSGIIWFDQGDIVHSLCGERSGEEAVYELLSWQGGEFRLDTSARAPETTITKGWQEVLLEGCRRIDESGRDLDAAFDFEDEAEEMPDTQVQIPAGMASSETFQANETVRIVGLAAPPPDERESQGVSAEELAPLRDLDGFVYAAYVNGVVHGVVAAESEKKDPLDDTLLAQQCVLEEIQALAEDLGTGEAVRSVVFTLQKQYHLNWPLSTLGTGLIALAMDRPDGDLAGARTRLRGLVDAHGDLAKMPASSGGLQDALATQPIFLDPESMTPSATEGQ